jgi:hypothetical protein
MKSSAALEIENLRAEVRRLQHEIDNLESRLSESGELNEERWNIWPYTWFVSAWQYAAQAWNTLGDRIEIWRLERANLRTLRQNRQGSRSMMRPV